MEREPEGSEQSAVGSKGACCSGNENTDSVGKRLLRFQARRGWLQKRCLGERFPLFRLIMVPAGMVKGAKEPEMGFFAKGDCAQGRVGSFSPAPALLPLQQG